MPRSRLPKLAKGAAIACRSCGLASRMRWTGLNEGDLVDLAQGGDALENLLQRRLAEEDHPLLLGDALDLRARTARQDELADGVGEVEQLGDGEAAVEAGAVAIDAAG